MPLKDKTLKVSVILAIIGGIEFLQALKTAGSVTPAHAVALILGLVIAAGLAFPRAATTRLYQDPEGRWMRRGSAITVVLWIVAIASHIVLAYGLPLAMGDHSNDSVQSAGILLYLGVTLGLQSWLLQQRVARHIGSPTPKPPVYI